MLSNAPTTGGTHGQAISHVPVRLSRGLGVWKQLLVRVGFGLVWEWGTSLGGCRPKKGLPLCKDQCVCGCVCVRAHTCVLL